MSTGSIVIDRTEGLDLIHDDSKKTRNAEGYAFFVSNRALVVFTRYFAVLIRSGISAFRALSMLEMQEKNPLLKRALLDICMKVEDGARLYEAFDDHRDIFGDLYVALVRVGEETGRLYEVLENIGDYLENRIDMKRKLISVFAYPIFISFLIFVISMAIFYLIVPRFEALYWQMDLTMDELPMITINMLWLSALIRRYILHGIALFFLSVGAFNIFYRTGYGRFVIDGMLLKLPGKFSLKLNLVRFTETLSVLFESGFTILNALDRSIKVVQNMAARRHLESISSRIENGSTISDAFKAVVILPDMTVQMVTVGEETASFDEMMKHISYFYRKDLDFTIQTIVAWIEPGLIILMGAAVTLILLAIYLPIFSLAGKIKVI